MDVRVDPAMDATCSRQACEFVGITWMCVPGISGCNMVKPIDNGKKSRKAVWSYVSLSNSAVKRATDRLWWLATLQVSRQGKRRAGELFRTLQTCAQKGVQPRFSARYLNVSVGHLNFSDLVLMLADR